MQLRRSLLLCFDEKFLDWCLPCCVWFRGEARENVVICCEASAVTMIMSLNFELLLFYPRCKDVEMNSFEVLLIHHHWHGSSMKSQCSCDSVPRNSDFWTSLYKVRVSLPFGPSSTFL
ncbi:hypothetical protein SAY87_022367 [Trapa incisa]|uniref:Uncharacterized protein n=1 Tax=Trapa incisa TaxID=236973 RepID=A0AAN7K3N6_9MYRT|nr:hypothetical protein SAY87_022367 [Trapa incisa]